MSKPSILHAQGNVTEFHAIKLKTCTCPTPITSSLHQDVQMLLPNIHTYVCIYIYIRLLLASLSETPYHILNWMLHAGVPTYTQGLIYACVSIRLSIALAVVQFAEEASQRTRCTEAADVQYISYTSLLICRYKSTYANCFCSTWL